MQVTKENLQELEFPKLLAEISPYAYSPKVAEKILHLKLLKIDEAEITLKNKIVKPEDKEVLDAKYTNEHWCLNKVFLHKKGQIRIMQFEHQDYRYTFCGTTFTTDVNKNIHFDWIDRT